MTNPPRADAATEAQRIVSLLSSATEMLYALDLEDRVVAVSHECDYPADVTLKPRVTTCNIDDTRPGHEIDVEVRERMQSGQPLYSLDEPRIAEFAPDLIVTQSQCDVCAIRHHDVLNMVSSHESLAQTEVVALNPASLDEILADIQRVADAAGVSTRGRELIDSLHLRLQRVADNLSGLAEQSRPRVVCIEWIEPLMLSSNWIPRLVKLAGGQSGLTQEGQQSVYGEWNQVVAYDPDVIVVMPCGFDLPRTIEESQCLADLSGWSGLSAVQRNCVYAVDGNAYFNRAGPRIIDSLEILAHLIHPRRCSLPTADVDIPPRVARLKLTGDVLEPVPVQ